MKYINKTPSSLFIALLAIITLLQSCQKDQDDNEEEDDKAPRLIKIIDWESAQTHIDSIPEYTAQYEGDKIIAMIGKYQDTIALEYHSGGSGNYTALSSISRSRRFGLSGYFGRDTFDFKSADFDDVLNARIKEYYNADYYTWQGLNLNPSSTSDALLYDGSSGDRQKGVQFDTDIKVGYNSQGDINSITQEIKHIVTSYSYAPYYHIIRDTIRYTVLTEVSYSTKENKLKEVYKNMAMLDPSCRNAYLLISNVPDKQVNTFPFSLHYGSKCISDYRMTYIGKQGVLWSITRTVSYEFNQQGYITKILIDNQPFKEFVYADE